MFFHWFGNKRGDGFVWLACTNIDCSVVFAKEREALARAGFLFWFVWGCFGFGFGFF